jgi:voltage-gated potassium channel
MGVLGILFLLLVLGQAVTDDQPLVTVLSATSWVLWAVFVAEFALRAWLARHRAREFWKRNWWQLIFLAVPFLRFARAATALRRPRHRVVAAAVRGSRSAGRLLTDRPAWLAVVTLQNWQSELLAVTSMVVLSIYLRQRGSSQSKPVGAAHVATGVEG